MQFPYGEPVTVARAGVTVSTFAGAWDPTQNAMYGPFAADVQEGDVLAFRGIVRRILSLPERWRSPFTGWEAGTVCKVEPAPAFMPDFGVLLRKTSTEVYDTDTDTLTPAVWSQVWSGVCAVDAAKDSDGTTIPVAEQKVGVVPFTVVTPLALEDVRTDDRFDVTSSRDGRLKTVVLNVTQVLSGTSALVREFRAIENQG